MKIALLDRKKQGRQTGRWAEDVNVEL
jgi:hypothetical protein